MTPRERIRPHVDRPRHLAALEHRERVFTRLARPDDMIERLLVCLARHPHERQGHGAEPELKEAPPPNTTVALFVSAHAGVACASSTGILEAIVRANERRQAET